MKKMSFVLFLFQKKSIFAPRERTSAGAKLRRPLLASANDAAEKKADEAMKMTFIGNTTFTLVSCSGSSGRVAQTGIQPNTHTHTHVHRRIHTH